MLLHPQHEFQNKKSGIIDEESQRGPIFELTLATPRASAAKGKLG
jgi:hypothetical protein